MPPSWPARSPLALEAHENALAAFERHPDCEWLYQRARGGSDVVAAMAARLEEAPMT